MDNQEYIDNALYELEKVNIEELPEEIQEAAIYTCSTNESFDNVRRNGV